MIANAKSRGPIAATALAVLCLIAVAGAGPAYVPPATQSAGSPPTTQSTQPKITVARDTTYLLGPLTADGRVDYFTAYDREMSAGVKPEENAVIALLKAQGPKSLSNNPKYRPAEYKRYGIDPLPEEGPYFVPLSEFLKTRLPSSETKDILKLSEKARAMLAPALQRPWKARDYPVLADWLQANEKPLALVADAVKLPRYYIPPEISPPERERLLISISLPSFGGIRNLAQAFTARAMLRVGDGAVDDAWQDLMAVHRFANLIPQRLDGTAHMVSVALDSLVFQSASPLLSSGLVTADRAKRMMADLSSQPLVAGRAVQDWIRLDRCWALEFAIIVATSKDPMDSLSVGAGLHRMTRREEKGKDRIPNLPVDWDEALRVVNRMYDRLAEAAAKPEFAARLAALEQIDREGKRLIAEREKVPATRPDDLPQWVSMWTNLDPRARGQWVGNAVLGFMLPSAASMSKCLAAGDERRQMMSLALAMAAFKADKGQYPERLDDLKPAYLAEVPADLFTGQPLKYRREPAGFVLYSVGPNMKDDNGRPTTRLDAAEDDIVIRVPGQWETG